MRPVVRDRIVVLLFMAALVVQGILLGLGMKPENIENRVLAPVPVGRANKVLDPLFYASLDRFLGDNFPLRTAAVTVRALIDYRLLGGSTNPDVLVGRDGWLFPADEFEPACRMSAAAILRSLDQVAAAFAATGRPLRFVIPPDKRAIYPDMAAPGLPYPSACTETERQQLRAGFAARPAIATDLWAPVLAERASVDEPANAAGPAGPIYWRSDTHWNDIGALAAIGAIVEAEAPGVWDTDDIRIDGVSPRVGDLSRLIGLPDIELAPRVVIDRGGVLSRHDLDAGIVTTPGRELVQYRLAGGGPTVPGRTLIVYDSAFGVHADLIAPWFADSVWLHVNELIEHPRIVAALPPFDRILVERVERLAYSRDLATTLAPLLP